MDDVFFWLFCGLVDGNRTSVARAEGIRIDWFYLLHQHWGRYLEYGVPVGGATPVNLF